MSSQSLTAYWAGLAILVMAISGCSRGPDLNSPNVQKAWVQVNEQKAIDVVRSQGLVVEERVGESQVKVAEFYRYGMGVCVIFIDKNNDPPQVVTAAFLLPTSADGHSWRSAGYIATAGADKKLKTISYEKGAGEQSPDLGFELDSFLSRHGMVREKLQGEDALRFF